MKLNRFYLLLAIASAHLAACTNLVNNETDSLVRRSAGGFTPGNPSALLESAYIDLTVYGEHANIFALGQISTADLIAPTRGVNWSDNGVWRSIEQHTWDATHPYITNSWNSLNQRVYKATEIIASNPTPMQKAEAQFLRAFHMFWVMDFFGQVPFREVTQGVNDLPRVFARSDAFDFIVKDLTEALPVLDSAPPGPSNGKANKASANFLLAKLYLNKAVFKSAVPEGPYTFEKADMDKVIALVEAIADDGYSLDPNYFNIFSNTSNAETIFVCGKGIPDTRWKMTLSYSQKPSGWNGFSALASFYDTFEKEDLRRGSPGKSDGTKFSGIGLGFLVGQQYDDNGNQVIDVRTMLPLSFTREVPLLGAGGGQGIRVIKYHPSNYGHLTFMRYGEATLMKAEAQLRGGDVAGAMSTANDLRRSRKASALTQLTEDNLYDEICREIYWEGFRRTTDVRFKKFTAGEGVEKTDACTVLYPIPLSALISNSNLQQNVGYK